MDRIALLLLLLAVFGFLAVLAFRFKLRRFDSASNAGPAKIPSTPAKPRHVRTFRGAKQYDACGRKLPNHPQRAIK